MVLLCITDKVLEFHCIKVQVENSNWFHLYILGTLFDHIEGFANISQEGTMEYTVLSIIIRI